MIENKLQVVARTIGRWIIASKGVERSTLAEVLALVTEVMGTDQETSGSEDPVFWFDEKGRFCTRAQTKKEIEDSMVLMAIAEGVPAEAICKDDVQWKDRISEWSAFQEMKLKYMEERMRSMELADELERVLEENQKPINQRRLGDIDALKKFVLMAMDLAGLEQVSRDALARCFDMAPSLGVIDCKIKAQEEAQNEYS